MSEALKARAAWVLAAGLLGPGCGSAQDEPATAAWSCPSGVVPELAFATTVTGKVVVVDLATGAVQNTIAMSNRSIHGSPVFATDAGFDLFAPDPGSQAIKRVSLSATGESDQVVATIDIGHRASYITMSPDRRVVATGSSSPSIVDTGMTFDEFATFVSVADNSIMAKIALPSPSRIAYAADSSVAYIPQQNVPEIPVVDLSTFEIVDTLRNDAVQGGVESSGHSAVRDSDGRLCLANFTGSSFTCMDPTDVDGQVITPVDDKFVHDLAFDPRTGYLWLQTMAELPNPTDEVGNTSIDTHLRVWDLEGPTEVAAYPPPVALWHVEFGPDCYVYGSGSWGTLVKLDPTNGQAVAGMKISTGPQPLMTVQFTQ